MSDILKAIIDFFSYKGLHIGYKLSIVIICVLALVIINDITGLTRHYTLDTKLDQILKLKAIDPDILKHDSLVYKDYIRLKSSVINDRSESELLLNELLKRSNPNKQSPCLINSNSANSTSQRLEFTTMIDFYIIMIFMIGALFFNIISPGTTKKEKITGSVAMIILIPLTYIIGLLYKITISIIPVFLDNLWLNHVINIITPILLVTIILIIQKKVNTKRKHLNIP